MSCELTHSVLHGYLDGELDAARAAEFERHLLSCPQCVAVFGVTGVTALFDSTRGFVRTRAGSIAPHAQDGVRASRLCTCANSN